MRAGDITTVSVLDNDYSPDNEPFNLDPKLKDTSNEGQGATAFVSGKTVRYQAPNTPGQYSVSYSISDNVWKKLSPDIQKAMIDVAEEMLPAVCHQIQKADNETKKSLEAAGIRFETLRPEVNAKFKDLTKGVAKAWADGLDGRGKRGSDALREFEAAVAAIPAQ